MQVHWWNSASFKWAFVAKHVSFAFNVYLDGIECCIISSNLKLPAGTFQTNHLLPHLFFHLICWENSHIFFLTNVKHAVFVLGKGIRERDGPAGLCHFWSGTRCSKHGPEKHSWRRRPERKSSQVGTVWVLSQTLLSNAEKKNWTASEGNKKALFQLTGVIWRSSLIPCVFFSLPNGVKLFSLHSV